MKRIIKSTESLIIAEGYEYGRNAHEILEQLKFEQGCYCAYTEERTIGTFSCEVEHFNPTLKNTVSDSYYNWFSASTLLNRNKDVQQKKNSPTRWALHQPIMLPTAEDLETRLIYDDGYYIESNPEDQDAIHLRDYLCLNDFGLPACRINHIAVLNDILESFDGDTGKFQEFLEKHSNTHLTQYRTAIKTVFNIEIK